MDVTSKATDGLVKLSPFFPHGDIPVPFSQGYTATWGGQRYRYIGSLFRGAPRNWVKPLNLSEK